MDAPETPAPVFAVRAFKHAIFGTPQTVQPKPPRRHSNNDTTRPRHNGRPGLARPKSTSDAQTIGSMDVAVEDDLAPSPLPSPTKGILLTPGTATTRRKTVSFGTHVTDNEGKRPMKSGLPDDCPGKFPSPWEQSFVNLNIEESAEKPRGRNKLTEALEQVREESGRKCKSINKPRKTREEVEVTTDLAEPQSVSGKYWKQEYDIYRERTTHEVRKLVEKNQQAKRYARDRDTDCTELREELRREQRKVEKLQRRNAELEALLREFQGKTTHPPPEESVAGDGNELLQFDSASGAIDNPAISFPKTTLSNKPARPERRSWKHTTTQQASDPKPELRQPGVKEEENDRTAAEEAGRKTRPRPRHVRSRTTDDPWAPSFASSSVGAPAGEKELLTNDDASPLKSLNVNTLTEKTHSVAISMGLQPPSPTREQRQDSPMRSPTRVPAASFERPIREFKRAASPAKLSGNDDLSIQVPESSPFQPDIVSERPNVLTGAPVPSRTTARLENRPPVMKENISPQARMQQPRDEENQRPSAAWQAMNTANIGQLGNEGSKNAMPDDRLAAAKARLASRGRQVS